jgi:hypothetical protein
MAAWRQGGELAATVKLTATRRPAAYATLGEVATHPSFRRRGIAQQLCQRAQDDFQSLGGQMIALGTGNPAAARRYIAIGYRRLPGTAVWWNNLADSRSPEEWAVDHFRAAAAATAATGAAAGSRGGPCVIAEGTAAARVRMLPLMHYPHDSLLSLDANVGLYSTRVSIMTSVNGLYPRYANLVAESKGQWWTAEAQGEQGCSGALVGLATACWSSEEQDGVVWVDGFLHGRWLGPATSEGGTGGAGWAQLMQQGPLRCATATGQFKRACARVPTEDTVKLALFESLGFETVAGVRGQPFPFVCSYPVEGDNPQDGEVREQESVLLQLELPRAAQ